MPLFASGKFSGQSRRGLYGDVVEEIDWSVGQVLDTLRREGLDKNTLVFFTSDNGPWLIQGEAGGSAGLLRDGKGSTWEGGMREPGIAWWPGRVPAGVVTHELACTMDLFHHLPETGRGRRSPGPSHRRPGPAAASVRHGAESAGSVLLLPRHPALRRPQGTVQGPLHHAIGLRPRQACPARSAPAVHLGHDPSERFDVAGRHPDVLADIAKEVQRHRATVTPVKSQLAETVKSD